MEDIKKLITERLEYCNAIAQDIIRHKACEGVIQHAKKYATIQSPMTGETDAAWVRIEFDDIYIFVFLNEDEYYGNGKVLLSGEISYQLDPACAYGAELIDVHTTEEFYEKLSTMKSAALRRLYGAYSEADIRPGVYTNYSEAEGSR